MKKLVLYILCLCLVSCETEEHSLEFDVEKTAFEEDRLSIIISSESNLTQVIEQQKISNIYMFCPLTTNKFTVENIEKEPVKIIGFSDLDTKEKKENRYYYQFYAEIEKKDNYTFKESKIKSECINCKLVIAFFPRKIKENSFSKPFCLPKNIVSKYFEE